MERNQLLLEAAQAPLEAPKDGFFARLFPRDAQRAESKQATSKRRKERL